MPAPADKMIGSCFSLKGDSKTKMKNMSSIFNFFSKIKIKRKRNGKEWYEVTGELSGNG